MSRKKAIEKRKEKCIVLNRNQNTKPMNIITTLWIIFGAFFSLNIANLALFSMTNINTKLLHKQTCLLLIILIINWSVNLIWSGVLFIS